MAYIIEDLMRKTFLKISRGVTVQHGTRNGTKHMWSKIRPVGGFSSPNAGQHGRSQPRDVRRNQDQSAATAKAEDGEPTRPSYARISLTEEVTKVQKPNTKNDKNNHKLFEDAPAHTC